MRGDARKRAEEALEKHRKAFGWHEENGCRCVPCALSRLLAETAPETPGTLVVGCAPDGRPAAPGGKP